MPVVLLRLTEPRKRSPERPQACPHCGSQLLQRWGQVTKSLKDQNGLTVILHRYRCKRCQRTFRYYQDGIDQSDYTLGTQKLAALIWLLGLSCRQINEVFRDYDIELSHSTVCRKGQELVAQLNAVRPQDRIKHFCLDPDYSPGVNSNWGTTVALDFGTGESTVIGTLNEQNPEVFISWVRPLIEDANIQIVRPGTQELERF